MNLLTDPRIRNIRWKDLTRLSLKDAFIENTVSIPWITASWILAYYEIYWLAVPCSFMFFLTALRQVHNGYHYTLGIGRKATWFVLFLNSIIMLAAMHAVKYNHLRHHKHCLNEEDVEGKCARMPGWKAILYGPVFIVQLHATALRSGNKAVIINVLTELLAIAVFVTLVCTLQIRFLQYHLIVMAFGECMTSFFAVWTVHHDCDEQVFARTQRSWWKNFFTYQMFYHLEHHLFPKVPTSKLPELARRIDEALPDVEMKEVF
ncbi:MAG: fatty acid desaturase [Chitinophagaceae bacterium]